MLDDQFISSPSWLPSLRFELRTLAGYTVLECTRVPPAGELETYISLRQGKLTRL